jgi:hypothetical protein
MAEFAFLSAVHDFLAAIPLTPAVVPGRIGAVEPVANADIPCVVLSLESSSRRRVGLGDRTDLMTGVLPVRASIDLANPVLPEEPAFRLIDVTRKVVTLPHGGLVHDDGSEAVTPLAPADIAVKLNNAPLTVTANAPGAGEAQADPIAGQLSVGTALPQNGTLTIDYFLGQWERRVERITGVLRLDACAATGADAERLAASCANRLLAPEARTDIVQLITIEMTGVGSVEQRVVAPGPPGNGVMHFRRRLSFAFEYQHLVDRADSSGGIIRRIPLVTRVNLLRVDRATGSTVTDTVVETK